ncbi:MAG: hypothetical protein QOE93_2019, partial [Actinomycetota bacterium]|nr:hypothetical protein [Actinomycetota bacterium]
PVRFKDPAGQRTEMDMTLVPGADGVLEAKASPAGVRLGSRADGVLATVETEAGPIVLHHPDAAAVGVSVHKDRATYSEALGKGRLDDQIATLGYELDVRRQGIDGIPAQPPQLHQHPRSLGRATPGLERTIELGFGLEL